MAGMMALFNRDGMPLDSELVIKVKDASSYEVVDNEGVWIGDGVALGCRHLHLLVTDQFAKQPYQSDAVCVVFSGRLDNREELGKKLGILPVDLNVMADVVLICRAYQQWGVACVDELLGDFAWLLWDEKKQHLFMVRDPLGVESFCYYVDEQVCVVATEIRQLLAHPHVPKRINAGKIAEYLEALWDNQKESFYEGIYYCLPAHCLLVTAEEVKEWRYWDIDAGKQIRYQEQKQYARHFRELLQQAVDSRLRYMEPIGLSLSGGLDSTSIAMLAQGGTDPLYSFSYIFDELHSCNERQFIEPVVQQTGIHATYLISDDQWTLRDLEQMPVLEDIATQDISVELTISVMRAAQEQGCRVLLTGQFADRLLSGGQFWVAELLRAGYWGTLMRLVRAHSVTQREIVNNGLRPLIPKALAQQYRQWHPRQNQWRNAGIHPDLRERTHLLERQQARMRWREFSRLGGQWERYRNITTSATTQGMAGLRQVSARYQIEYVDPFRDRRLVEYVMALPANELGLPWSPKHLLREAMRGILPEPVRTRTVSSSLVPLIEKGLFDKEVHRVRRLLTNPQIVQRGFVQEAWLKKMLENEQECRQNLFWFWLFFGFRIVVADVLVELRYKLLLCGISFCICEKWKKT